MITRTNSVSLLMIILLFLATSMYAANGFKPGKIKPINGPEQSVMVKFNSWKLTPKKIRYKLIGSDEVLTAEPESLEYFSVDNIVKFVSADVNIDVSSNIDLQLSPSRGPKWEKQRIFLEEETSVGVKLYYHKTNQYNRYFYLKPDSSEYIQLIYKRYNELQSTISINRDFRKQLQDDLKCEGLDIGLRTLDYKRKDLLRFFRAYNQCLGYELGEEKAEKAKAQFVFAVKGGLSYYGGEFTKIQLTRFRNVGLSTSQDYESTVGITFGAVGELILPYQNQVWSLLLEGQFERFVTSGELLDQELFTLNQVFARGSQPWDLTVSHFVFGLGLRRYFALGEEKRLYLNAGLNSSFAVQFDSEFELGQINNTPLSGGFVTEIDERINFFAGAGLSWSKFSIEARYGAPREVLSELIAYTSKYHSLSLMFGIRISK